MSIAMQATKYLKESDFDLYSREKAIHDVNTNFFVEAGAGSGKTTVMISRLVSMIENGIELKKICVATFTNASAGDLKSRLMEKLRERCLTTDENADSIIQERCKKALDILESEKTQEQCFIGTIHSYILLLLRRNTHKLDINGRVHPIKGIDGYADLFFNKIISRREENVSEDWLENAFFSLFDAKDEKLNQGNQARVRCVFKKIMNVMINNLGVDFVQGLELNKEEVGLIPTKEKFSEINNAEREDPVGKLRYKVAVFYVASKVEEFLEFKNNYYQDNCFCEEVFEHSGNPDNSEEVRTNIEEQIDLDLVSRFEGSPKKNQVDMTFSEYPKVVLMMLRQDAGKEGEIIRSNREKYFLLDEFQDTDPVQMQIFLYLATSKPMIDYSKNIPRPGSLFVVGDPKQSIYHFRYADVTIYLRIKALFESEEFENCEVLALYRNFRSTRALLEGFNGVFPSLFKESKYQCKYPLIPIEASAENSNEKSGIYGVRFTAERKVSEQGRNYTYEEIEKIVKLISSIVDNEKWLIRKKVEENGVEKYVSARIYPEDVMVLTYTNNKAMTVETELKRFNLEGVDVRTIHKSKGLEKPVVILAFHHYFEYHAPHTVITYNDDSTQGRIMNVWLDDKKNGKVDKRNGRTEWKDSLIHNYFNPELLKQEMKADEAEQVRLRYVAITRAKNLLFVFKFRGLYKNKEDHGIFWCLSEVSKEFEYSEET